MKNLLRTYLVLYFVLLGKIALAQSTPNGTSVASSVVYLAPLTDDEIDFLNWQAGIKTDKSFSQDKKIRYHPIIPQLNYHILS